MKSSMLVVFGSALLIAGCSHTKETVVEKQPVVEKQTVVEKPVVVQTEARSCSFAGTSYAHGSLSCQNRYEFKCSNGVWEGLNIGC